MTSFEQVYQTYFSDVFLYIKKISGNEQVVEDITSETFLKAMDAIVGFAAHVISAFGYARLQRTAIAHT